MNAIQYHVIPMLIVKMFLELLIAFVALYLQEMKQIVLVNFHREHNKSEICSKQPSFIF